LGDTFLFVVIRRARKQESPAPTDYSEAGLLCLLQLQTGRQARTLSVRDRHHQLFRSFFMGSEYPCGIEHRQAGNGFD
jgi:hypothetical protein